MHNGCCEQHTEQIGSSVSPREVVGIEGRMVALTQQQTKRFEIRNPDCKSNNADGLCVCRRLVWLPAACMMDKLYMVCRVVQHGGAAGSTERRAVVERSWFEPSHGNVFFMVIFNL